MNAWRWIEHVLALAGLAWLCLWVVDWLSMIVGKERDIKRIDRKVRQMLEHAWEERRRKGVSPDAFDRALAGVKAFQAAPASDATEAQRLARQADLLRWAGQIAESVAGEARRREALTDLYAKAGREAILRASQISSDDLHQIIRGVLLRESRPGELVRGLLHDMAEIYFQACEHNGVCASAATLVPMLLEEHLKTPEASGPELLARWRSRLDRALAAARSP